MTSEDLTLTSARTIFGLALRNVGADKISRGKVMGSSSRTRRFGRLQFVALAASAALICTTATSVSLASASTKGHAQSAALTSIIIGEPLSPPQVPQEAVFIAQQLGFFKQFGLSVHVAYMPNGLSSEMGTTSSSITLGMAGGSDSIEAAAQGAPIHAVWVDYQKLDLVCIGGPSIKTVKDLVGKNVASTGAGGFAETTMTACLNAGGVQQSQVHEITMTRAEFVPSLVNGQIQAAVFHADDAYTVTHSIKGAHVLNYLYKSLPSYWYGSLNVVDSYAAKHPLIVEDAIAAMLLADRWMLNAKNNSRFISLTVKTTQESKSAVSSAVNFDRSIRLWNAGCGVSPGSITFTSNMLKNQGATTSIPSFARVYTSKYCTAALSLIKSSLVKK